MDRNKTVAYKIGSLFAYILASCLAAAIIGVTIKFLFWLF
jgi:hypothetical protein